MTFAQIRCFLRPSRTYRLTAQKSVCEEAAARLGLDVVWYVQGEEAGSRDLWVRQVSKDEIAMVARLDMVTGPRKEIGGRPIIDYSLTMIELEKRAGLVIEASTGARSDKGKIWKDRVKVCAELIAQGRDLRPERAREMARKSAATRSPVAKVKLWSDPSMADEVARLRVIWRSREFRNDEERFLALPADARERLGTRHTARAVLKRIGDKPTKAGRPPKIKPRAKRKP